MNTREQLTKREFYCKDDLWNLFVQIAADANCTVDFLINEAMAAHAKTGNYDLRPAQMQHSKFSRPPSLFTPGEQQFRQQQYQQHPNQPIQQYQQPAPQFQQPAPQYQQHPRQYQQPTPAANYQQNFRQNQPGAQPHQQQYNAPSEPAAPVTRTLTLIYNNQRYPITKNNFIIGRASQITDLAIRDSNISRKHCAVVQRNGAYYIKDLNSTNGIEYKNNRIDSKKIEEGDKFNVCEHVFEFTYH